MATTYATVADVERELVAVLPDGFPVAPAAGDSTPSAGEVQAEITAVTTLLRVRVLRALGAEPEADDDAAALLKRAVVAKVVAWALRRVSTGLSAIDVESLTKPWEGTYREVVAEIALLPDLYRGEPQVASHVLRPSTTRDPVLADDAIGRTDLF